MPSLQDSLKIGPMEISNRIIMAPLTRCRADEGRVPNEMMVEYYRQRASAGFILTEATAISPMAVGYPDTPGIWTEEQVSGWKAVTDAVHQAGGRIVMQLWHVGRVSDPYYLDGELPVAPSPIALDGHVRQLRPMRPYCTPRALELDEIPGIMDTYAKAAENAKKAGFDGVQLHGANGYLPEQFLKDGANHRTDKYGGSIENRGRFTFEALDALIDVWGADRVGLHLSPANNAMISDSNPVALYTHVAKEVQRRNIAFICSREALTDNFIGVHIRKHYHGVFIANEAFTRETAQVIVETGAADAVAFGRLFIANPDLPKRIIHATQLNEPDAETFYSPGPQGYTDYPFLEESGKSGS